MRWCPRSVRDQFRRPVDEGVAASLVLDVGVRHGRGQGWSSTPSVSSAVAPDRRSVAAGPVPQVVDHRVVRPRRWPTVLPTRRCRDPGTVPGTVPPATGPGPCRAPPLDPTGVVVGQKPGHLAERPPDLRLLDDEGVVEIEDHPRHRHRNDITGTPPGLRPAGCPWVAVAGPPVAGAPSAIMRAVNVGDGTLEGREPGLPRGLLPLICAAVLVDTVFFTALTPLLPHYVHGLGLSKAGAGFLVAAYPLGTLVGALPGGVLRHPPRRTPGAVLLGLAVMSAATLVFGFSSSWPFSTAPVSSKAWPARAPGPGAWPGWPPPPPSNGGAGPRAWPSAPPSGVPSSVRWSGAVASRVGTGPAFAARRRRRGRPARHEHVHAQSRQPASARACARHPRPRDPGIAAGMWLTALAGIAFGVIDVLVPLRLNALGATAVVISAAFLGAAALEAALSPPRRAALRPAWLAGPRAGVPGGGRRRQPFSSRFVSPSWLLVALLVVGLPAFGVLFVPASAMISDGADRRRLHQGLAFGLANLAWAAGQAVAAASSGALAQATVDAFPFVLLAAAFALTALALRPSGRRLLARFGVPGTL